MSSASKRRDARADEALARACAEHPHTWAALRVWPLTDTDLISIDAGRPPSLDGDGALSFGCLVCHQSLDDVTRRLPCPGWVWPEHLAATASPDARARRRAPNDTKDGRALRRHADLADRRDAKRGQPKREYTNPVLVTSPSTTGFALAWPDTIPGPRKQPLAALHRLINGEDT